MTGSPVQLFETADNPIPPDAAVMSVTASDGMVLRAAYWKPRTRETRGTVCILQGRAEFIEKYFEAIGELLSRGFGVVAFDWRGQGLSGRQVRNARKGHVRRFEDYRKDIEAIRDQVLIPHMPEPYFALAHSMGGAIALQAAAEGWLPFRRLVTTTPMIALCVVRQPRSAALVAQLMYMLGLGRSFVPGGGETSISRLPFAGNRLTSDPLRYARNADAAAAVGPGAIGAPTVSWIHHAFRFMRRFTDPRFGLKVRIPTLIIAAGADPICATPATERLAVRLKAGRVIVIPGARHEILMERDEIREQFWAAFDAFIPGTSEESILPGRQPVAATAADEEPASAELRRMLLTPHLEPAAETDARLELAAEEFQGGGMDAAVAGRHDRAAAGR